MAIFKRAALSETGSTRREELLDYSALMSPKSSKVDEKSFFLILLVFSICLIKRRKQGVVVVVVVRDPKEGGTQSRLSLSKAGELEKRGNIIIISV